jgi:23S rRNA pseudouridine2457 synthase
MVRLRYFVCYKPFGVLCQFTSELGKRTLADLFAFPKDVYPIGRLDEDSEGLLLLTNDASMNQEWLGQGVEKEYCVQVEGIPTDESIAQLRGGVTIRVKKEVYQSLPAQAELLGEDPGFPPRMPPVRFRASIPTSWVRIVIREGKNRQVRRMTAAVGFPTLRLVRVRIGKMKLREMKPGEVQEVTVFKSK